jgi:redox-sensitive bicupin YhaK (pirin superfamily)
MPTDGVALNALDPFLFLNHHGWQNFLPHNAGLPFGPHPHRGFETVTFILEGDLTHKDSSGANSIIKAGGVQWMTAGSGLIHAEVSSEEFKALGGPLEILQLWVNLPAKQKMTAPKYTGLQSHQIPSVPLDNSKVMLHPVSGNWDDTKGPVKPITDIHLCWIEFSEGGTATFFIPVKQTILCYVVKGEVQVNRQDVPMLHLAEFNDDGDEVQMTANTAAVVLFGYATPLSEPVAAYGPFVMNTREEVMQAYDDFNNGKFGNAEDLL